MPRSQRGSPPSAPPLPPPARASHLRLVHGGSYDGNSVYVGIGGRELQVTDSAIRAFLLCDGRYAAWSRSDGLRRGNGELGESLYLLDNQTGSERRVLVGRSRIEQVEAVELTNAQEALIVTLRDLRAVAPHLAVVHPVRGQVFHAPLTEVIRRRRDLLSLRRCWVDDELRAGFEESTVDLKELLARPALRAGAPLQ